MLLYRIIGYRPLLYNPPGSKEDPHRAPNNHWISGIPYEVDPYSGYGRQPILLRSAQDTIHSAAQHQYSPGFSVLPSRLNQTWPPPSINTLTSTATTTTTTTSAANIPQPSTNFHAPDSATHWKGRILEPLTSDVRTGTGTGTTSRKRFSAGSEGRYEMPPLPPTHPAARPPFNGSPERVSSSDVSGRPARGSPAAVLNGRQPQRQSVTLVKESEGNAQGILPGIAPADAYVTDIAAIAPQTPVRKQPVQESPSNHPLPAPPTPPHRSPTPVENHTPSPSSACFTKPASPTPESPKPPPAPKSPTPPPTPTSPPSTTPESSSPQRVPVSLTASSEPDLNKNSDLDNRNGADDLDASLDETAALQQQIQQRRRRRTEPSSPAVAANGGLPTRSSSGPRRPTRAVNTIRSSLARNRQSEGDWSTPESLNRCLQQLDSADWEAAAAALRSLARQLMNSTGSNGTTHFGAAAQVQARLHVVCEALARQVRNLRSQVARAACDAAKSLFLTFRRAADTETEDLVAALFHRTADTNKFLRADSNAALDAMADSLSPGRAISIIIYKGCRHQNAIVRAEGARLLLRMVDNLGVERIMSQPRENRDLLLITATRLLTEGSLEARSYAKSLLRTLSRDPHLLGILIEIVPTNVMRNIDKTLKSLMRK